MDTRSAAGKAFLDMLGVFAEFETNLRRERQMEGIAAAKARGVYRGRKPSIDPAEVWRLYTKEKMGATAIARQLGIGRASELEEESLNQSHQIIIVAAELDPSTERIVDYLSKNGISINVLFFKVFQHGDEQFLSRAWLIDPSETQTNAAQATAGTSANAKEPWNGEFYVSFGDPNSRVWEEARRYGFISAGGGSWYSQTLKQLQPGDRVWVKIPATGYVGVDIVQSAVEPASSFTISTEDGEKLAMDVLKYSDLYHWNADDPDKSEYFVPVKWLETRSENDAVNEVGFFGNQNTVCKPTTPKWRHTI
ncbi:hypothetical protein D3C79_194430 [compost metagenome]